MIDNKFKDYFENMEKHVFRDTYAYFGASIGLTAASAIGVFRTPALLNIVARGGFISLGVSLAAMIGTGMVARSIPYEEGLGKKQLAWALHVSNILLLISDDIRNFDFFNV